LTTQSWVPNARGIPTAAVFFAASGPGSMEILECRAQYRWSHRFRPERSAHQAMDALVVGIGSMKVNWILSTRSLGDTLHAIIPPPLVERLQHR
jgi:hypothetical protein